ncbi:MAG: DNA-processing protein DprA [Oscillospiraceae bacterium]|nr:DNA-processing protein DprA [Oscillospiraceae bacterium]
MAGLKYWVWLSSLQGISGISRHLLLEHFGSPESIYYADEEEYRLVAELPRTHAALLNDKSTARADEILGECARLGIRIVTIQDADYPARLHDIYDPPILFYVRGTLPVIDEEVAVAMVGTRDATPYGIACAEKLACAITREGGLIVSGMAQGIDAAALRGALRGGGTPVSVIAGGHDIIYPRENAYLYADVAAKGAIISEYPPGTKPIGANFPVRNRIISGLSLATLVVEADVKSGALITANTALEQSRDVYAVPGPIDAPQSRGCNRLIAEGAGLVAESWDILGNYQAQYPHKIRERGAPPIRNVGYEARSSAKKKEPERTEEKEVPRAVLDLRGGETQGLTDDQINLLCAMPDEPIQVDELIDAAQIPARRALSALTMLELEGHITAHSGKYFSKNVTLLLDRE